MTSEVPRRSWQVALPKRLPPEVVLALAMAFILAMLVIPVPTGVLDIVLAANLTLAVLIMISAMLAHRPLALSTFPTVLLIATVGRLALNVSTTRMILSTGQAGEVVAAFGRFVLRGDVVVGMVMFLVLSLVQFMVIAKGAERVAEVGARFTLDALPGKQMSIDADLRNGAIDEVEARRLRTELGSESQFYGSMDGAMKFVKGDAVAGLVITTINLVAGLSIGMVRQGLPIAEAAEVYSTLTVGDGLVSQIPSLLIALAAGLLTTRVAGEGDRGGVAHELEVELFSRPQALIFGAAFSGGLALVPGLPTLPFLVIATVMGGLGLIRHREGQGPVDSFGANDEEVVRARAAQVQKQKTSLDHMAPSVSLLNIDLSEDLSAAFGFDRGQDHHTELLGTLVAQVREAVFIDTGVRIPGIRIRTKVPDRGPDEFAILIKEVPIYVGSIRPDKILAVASPQRLGRMGTFDIQEVTHPVSGIDCAWVPKETEDALKTLGIQTWSSQGYIGLSVLAKVKDNLPEFLGVQEVGDMLDQVRQLYPTLVEETVPKLISIGHLVEVLRSMTRERISIRDMRSILDAVSEAGEQVSDIEGLAERVRRALRLQIVHAVAGGRTSLGVIVVHPDVEAVIEAAVVQESNGRYLAMEPETKTRLLQSVANAIHPILEASARPVFLTRSAVRGHLGKMIESHFPFAHTLSYDDLPPSLEVHPLASLDLA